MALALLLGGLGQLLVRVQSQQEVDSHSHRLDREDRLGQGGQPQPHQEITTQGCTTCGILELFQISKIQKLVQST